MTPDATDNLTKSFKPMNADHENPLHVSGHPPPIAYESFFFFLKASYSVRELQARDERPGQVE
jgi:hypothetical protein